MVVTVLLVATCACLPLVILASTVNNYIQFLNLNHTLTLVYHTTGGDVRVYTINGRGPLGSGINRGVVGRGGNERYLILLSNTSHC